jgi:hypothetical protein
MQPAATRFPYGCCFLLHAAQRGRLATEKQASSCERGLPDAPKQSCRRHRDGDHDEKQLSSHTHDHLRPADVRNSEQPPKAPNRCRHLVALGSRQLRAESAARVMERLEIFGYSPTGYGSKDGKDKAVVE